jgi:hypothetical protein
MGPNCMLVRTTLFSIVLTCFFSSLTFAQVTIPDDILSTLKKGHPRLMVTSFNDFQDIKDRAATDDFLKQSIRNVLENADSILNQPVMTFINKQGGPGISIRIIYFRTYFLSMAYRLTNDKKYSMRLWADLEAESRFPDWQSNSFIITGNMTYVFAIAYDWLYDIWTPQQRDYLKQQIISKGIMQGFRYYNRLLNQDQNNWIDGNLNWSAVCNGGLIMGALAIGEEEPVISGKILKEALNRYPETVAQFGPDGAFVEGPTYWWYAMAFGVTPVLASLETALGTDFGMSNIEGFSKTGLFFVNMGGANTACFNYADADLKPIIAARSAELFWLANKYNQPELTEMQKQYSLEKMKTGMWQQAPLELLWYRPCSITTNNLSLDNYQRGIEIASLRGNWNDNKAWFVAFKAGNNGSSHSHLDIGSYVIDNQGVRWISDLGFQTYGVPGYFSETGKGGKRWSYYRTRAEGHNTLVINPEFSEDQEITAKTKFTSFRSTPGKAFGIMDITDAYRQKVLSAKRGIALLNRNSVLVQDEIVSDRKIDLYWFAHTSAKITLSADRRNATMEIDGKKMAARLHSPKNAVFEVMETKPLPTSPQPVQNDINEGVKKLSIHVTGENKTTIAVEYYEIGKSAKQKIVPLIEW